ncbi:acyl-CoA ligase [Mycobacterium tuberculosis]|nr:acyl-CoA ligase [Mycobacterium tuberculosis]
MAEPTGMKRAAIAARRAAIEAAHRRWEPGALHEHLDRKAAEFGSRPYLIFDDAEFTYTEVADLSRRYATGLRRLGVRPGDHVGLLLANHRELPVLKYAISRIGAVSIGFNFLLKADELAYVLNHSGCSVLITMTEYGSNDYLAMLERIQPEWRQGRRDRLPRLDTVVVLSAADQKHSDVQSLADLIADGDDSPPPVEVDPGSPCDILYTSGTTGRPKAVVLTHEALLTNSYASALSRAFDDGWRIVFSLPMYHVFGYAEGLLATTWVGGAVVPRLKFSAADYLASIEQHRADDILCVPTMTIAILESPDIGRYDLSSLRAVFSAAAPSPDWVWARAVELLGVTEVITGYGMTEMCGAVLVTLPEDGVDRLTSVVGRMKMGGTGGIPSAGGGVCEFRVVDTETGEDLPVGRAGELVWCGPVVAQGFWNGERVEPVGADGWLRSGDLGYVDADGYFQLTGRCKDVYKSGGELVLPVEVETFISRIDGVAQCYVVGVPDERWGEVGRAYVVPAPGARIDPDKIIQTCKNGLARFKVPREVVVIDAESLPKTATGKVRKFKLLERTR